MVLAENYCTGEHLKDAINKLIEGIKAAHEPNIKDLNDTLEIIDNMIKESKEKDAEISGKNLEINAKTYGEFQS